VESFGADGCTLLEDLRTVTEGQVKPEALALAVPSVIQIWHAFVPPGTRGRNVTRAHLREAIARQVVRILEALPGKGSEPVDALMADSPQPGILQAASAQLADLYEKIPRSQWPSPTDHLMLVVLLRAVVEVLDEVQRDR
jgi:hypothetical protein